MALPEDSKFNPTGEACLGFGCKAGDLCPPCSRLRDELAMAAPFPLVGIDAVAVTPEVLQRNAGNRYRWADAMMEARKPK